MFPIVFPCHFCHLPASIEELSQKWVTVGWKQKWIKHCILGSLCMQRDKYFLIMPHLTERSQTDLGYFNVNREKFAWAQWIYSGLKSIIAVVRVRWSPAPRRGSGIEMQMGGRQEGAVPGAGCRHRPCGTGAQQRRGGPGPAERHGRRAAGDTLRKRAIVVQPCKNRNKMQLKSSSPKPAPAIMLPMTAAVAVVPAFPFRSLASAGTGTEAEPSGMPGRQRCARLVMGYIILDKMMLPDTLPVRATL